MDAVAGRQRHAGLASQLFGRSQLAVFRFASRGEWYASQNMCPHKKQLVLARGIVGDADGIPKVACPLHKKTFSLTTGECLSGEAYELETFRVRTESGRVYVELPKERTLEERLSTAGHRCAIT